LKQLYEKHAAEGDFVYLDPPYATRARRIFQEYDPATFTIEDLARLAKLLNDLAAKGVTFVLFLRILPGDPKNAWRLET